MEIEELKAFANKKLEDEFKEKLARKLTDDTTELLSFIQSLVNSIGACGEDAIFASFGHAGSCKKR